MTRITSMKCPECRAALEIAETDTQTMCRYCGASVRITPPETDQPAPADELVNGGQRPVRKAPAWITAIIIFSVVLPILITGVVLIVVFFPGATPHSLNGTGPGSGGSAGQKPGEHMQWQGTRLSMLLDVNADGIADPVGWIRFLTDGNGVDHIAAFNAVSGERLWMTPPIISGSQAHETLAALSEQTVLVALPAGIVTAFSALNGEQRWSVNVGERVARFCGDRPGTVRIDRADEQSLIIPLATGQVSSPTAAADDESPSCDNIQTTERHTNPLTRLYGTTSLEGDLPLPEITGMQTKAIAVDRSTGVHVALGIQWPGTGTPIVAKYDPAARGKSAPLWMASINTDNPLLARVGVPESAVFSRGRLIVPYQRAAEHEGWRLACIDTATGRNLWEVSIPNSKVGIMGPVIASDRMVFVSHWTWLEIFDLGTGAHRTTVGVW